MSVAGTVLTAVPALDALLVCQKTPNGFQSKAMEMPR